MIPGAPISCQQSLNKDAGRNQPPNNWSEISWTKTGRGKPLESVNFNGWLCPNGGGGNAGITINRPYFTLHPLSCTHKHTHRHTRCTQLLAAHHDHRSMSTKQKKNTQTTNQDSPIYRYWQNSVRELQISNLLLLLFCFTALPDLFIYFIYRDLIKADYKWFYSFNLILEKHSDTKCSSTSSLFHSEWLN